MSFNYTSNRLENFKIPNNNPLANMNNFNKFDDPNLNINVMNLSINSISFENNQFFFPIVNFKINYPNLELIKLI